MMSITSTRYLSNVDWLQDVVQGKDLILCGVSALEFLELFNGYVNESKIQVYAKSKGQFDNIEYHIVDSFDNIEYLNFDGVLCTTVNQTINDMLANYDNIDELAFLEALSNYYFANDESFDNLKIKPENLNTFNQVKQIAIEYYCED
uniref:hypothetical protein n=1 Tax=Ruminococcus bromii TaxID=40518 RepID=UPI003FED7C6E